MILNARISWEHHFLQYSCIFSYRKFLDCQVLLHDKSLDKMGNLCSKEKETINERDALQNRDLLLKGEETTEK